MLNKMNQAKTVKNISPVKLGYYFGVASAGLAVGAGAFLLYRWLKPLTTTMLTPTIDPQVKENLPIAKNLKTIPDATGNYDIDGVSFDSEGVVVSSDDNKHAKPTLN